MRLGGPGCCPAPSVHRMVQGRGAGGRGPRPSAPPWLGPTPLPLRGWREPAGARARDWVTPPGVSPESPMSRVLHGLRKCRTGAERPRLAGFSRGRAPSVSMSRGDASPVEECPPRGATPGGGRVWPAPARPLLQGSCSGRPHREHRPRPQQAPRLSTRVLYRWYFF